MPRFKIELDPKLLVPIPRDAALLDSDHFLRVVRVVRSGDVHSLTLKEWMRMAKRYSHLTEPKAIESICYRWFLHCWHELLLAGFEVDPYRMAQCWQFGPRVE